MKSEKLPVNLTHMPDKQRSSVATFHRNNIQKN